MRSVTVKGLSPNALEQIRQIVHEDTAPEQSSEAHDPIREAIELGATVLPPELYEWTDSDSALMWLAEFSVQTGHHLILDYPHDGSPLERRVRVYRVRRGKTTGAIYFDSTLPIQGVAREGGVRHFRLDRIIAARLARGEDS